MSTMNWPASRFYTGGSEKKAPKPDKVEAMAQQLTRLMLEATGEAVREKFGSAEVAKECGKDWVIVKDGPHALPYPKDPNMTMIDFCIRVVPRSILEKAGSEEEFLRNPKIPDSCPEVVRLNAAKKAHQENKDRELIQGEV